MMPYNSVTAFCNNKIKTSFTNTISVLNETLMIILAEDCDEKLLIKTQQEVKKLGLLDIVIRESEMNWLVKKTKLGNDIKTMISYGNVLGKTPPHLINEITPPNPATISKNDIIYNMEKYGFGLHNINGNVTRDEGNDILPEYLFVAMLFSRNLRYIDSGLPVMLCNADMRNSLLLFLSKKYRFSGTLLGLLLELKLLGRNKNFDYMIKMLQNYGIEPKIPENGTVERAVLVYGC